MAGDPWPELKSIAAQEHKDLQFALYKKHENRKFSYKDSQHHVSVSSLCSNLKRRSFGPLCPTVCRQIERKW
jgi:hypothetical protein